MSGSLKRALALWAAGKVEGLHVYADDIANVKHQYPSCSVIEVSRDVGPIGCGRSDYKVREGSSGNVAAIGRVHREATVYRLTISAPSDTEKNGQEVVDGILGIIEKAVLQAAMSNALFVLRDTETTPEESFPAEAIRLQGRQSIPPDTSGEPVVYRGALSLEVACLVPLERPVENVIERIHVVEDR